MDKSRLVDTRNLLLIVVVLLIIGFVGFWLPYQRSRPAPATTTSSKESSETVEVKVTYSEHGFEPQTVTVPVGTTVAWSNPSGKPMWVASDPHPSHDELPGFDQGRTQTRNNRTFPLFTQVAYAHGDSTYEYTFTNVGIWKYHNHLYPQHRGTVTVSEK